MVTTILQIIKLAEQFEVLAKKKTKLDPKAKVRNRGTVCVPASSAKDKKDHFPINSISQGRNALVRVHQYSKVPSWHKGSLKGLQDLVSRKVHSKYPSIGKAKKKSSELEELMFMIIKFAEATSNIPTDMSANDLHWLDDKAVLYCHPPHITESAFYNLYKTH